MPLLYGTHTNKTRLLNLKRSEKNRHRNTGSVSDMLSALGWDTLERRRKDARLTLLHKLQNGTASIHCPDLKPAISRSRHTTTAHSKQLDRYFCKNDYRLNALFPRIIKDWNSLPEEAVQATCHDTFLLYMLSQFQNYLLLLGLLNSK